MKVFQYQESIAGRRDLFVQMVSTVDHVSPKTGLSMSVEMVKAGATSYGSIAGSWTEVGSGTYRIRLATADLDTEGQGMLKVTGSGAVTQFVPVWVVRMMGEVHLAKAALVNARRHVVDTGVDEIKDDDGSTTLRTLTPSESDGVISVTAG